MTNLQDILSAVGAADKRHRRQFNPRNEPIILLKVVEKKNYTAIRHWIGFREKDEEESRARGYAVHHQAAPTRKHRNFNEADLTVSGKRDVMNFIDPDELDEKTGAPVKRQWRKDEVFLAPLSVAVWMEYEEYVVPMRRYKNSPAEGTGKARFDWADEHAVITDENGFLLPQYMERYASETFSAIELSDMLKEVLQRIESLESGKNHGR